MTDERYLFPADNAARHIGIPVRRLLEWAAKDIVPVHYVDGRPRFDFAELDEWVNMQRGRDEIQPWYMRD